MDGVLDGAAEVEFPVVCSDGTVVGTALIFCRPTMDGALDGATEECTVEGTVLVTCETPMEGVLDGTTDVKFSVSSTEGTAVGNVLIFDRIPMDGVLDGTPVERLSITVGRAVGTALLGFGPALDGNWDGTELAMVGIADRLGGDGIAEGSTDERIDGMREGPTVTLSDGNSD